MKRLAAILLCWMLAGAALRAQAVPSATTGQFSITAGAIGSIFQPDYLGSNMAQTNGQSIRFGLVGVGTFVDLRFRRWIQVEAEGRWLQFNINPVNANVQVSGTPPTVNDPTHEVTERTYLIGPRIPLHRFGRVTPYVKALVGFGRTSLNPDLFPTIAGSPDFGGFAQAYGGGVDYRLSKHINIRVFDAEYQSWTLSILNTATSQTWNFPIHPYGASAGISYRIF
jgi:opacity protein-like surface antigen